MINSYFLVSLLCGINLINYMDRFTIAGVLKDVKQFFDMNDAQGGLLQTAFIISYMIFAPVFGFLGDRYSRKKIIIGGVFFWSIMTLFSSFVQKHHSIVFFIFRGLVGIGEASYATVAPTLIADLFAGSKRSTMLALFYFAIPIGSGLGYIVGIMMASTFGDWRWALRFTPIFGILSVIGFIFVTEPERGAIDGVVVVSRDADSSPNEKWLNKVLKSLKSDLSYLCGVPTYIYTTLGFTCVTFSVGALSWWAPFFMQHAIIGATEEKVGFIFGVIACVGGFTGVTIGFMSSHYFRPKYPTADPIICAVGVLLSIPTIFLCIFIARRYPSFSWFNIFLGITFLSLNWSIVVDILLYVTIPNRRSTAQALQILTSHILGDAASPFIIGAISDAIFKQNKDKYKSMSYALYLTPFILIFGVIFFLVSSRYLLKDEYNCKIEMTGSEVSSNENIPHMRTEVVPESESTNNLINSTLFQRNVEYRKVSTDCPTESSNSINRV